MNTEGSFISQSIDLGSRYVFETVLGRGGMGVVLRAQDTLLNRPVAVKVLSDELAGNAEAQEIFLTESRSLATLSHPNLVGIYDVTEIAGRAMMVFEYVDGKTLDATLREQGPLPESEVVRVALELANAFAYLHDKNVIHRDLKPANVMIQPNGKVTLIDFGLARSLEDIAERGTRVRGSPAYMAPEQVTGEQLGHRTDIYALGMTLFELLAGKLPFDGGDMSFAQVHRQPPSLGTMRTDLHPDLVIVVDRCIAKSPVDRPESATELRQMLQRIATDLAAGVRPSKPRLTALHMDTGRTTASHEIKRNSGLIVALALLTVVFVGVLVTVLMKLDMISMPGAGEPEVVAAPETPPVPAEPVVAVVDPPTLDAPKEAVSETGGRVWLGVAAGRSAADAVAASIVDRQPATKEPRKNVANKAPEPEAVDTPEPLPAAEKPVEEPPVVVEKPDEPVFKPVKFGAPVVTAEPVKKPTVKTEPVKKPVEEKPKVVAPPVSF